MFDIDSYKEVASMINDLMIFSRSVEAFDAHNISKAKGNDVQITLASEHNVPFMANADSEVLNAMRNGLMSELNKKITEVNTKMQEILDNSISDV